MTEGHQRHNVKNGRNEKNDKNVRNGRNVKNVRNDRNVKNDKNGRNVSSVKNAPSHPLLQKELYEEKHRHTTNNRYTKASLCSTT